MDGNVKCEIDLRKLSNEVGKNDAEEDRNVNANLVYVD